MHVIDPEVVDFVKREFVAGGAAGSIGIFIGYPFDIVKVNLQVLRTSIQQHGLASLKFVGRMEF